MDKLVRDLWWFIENVNDETPDRTERFFALRARVRTWAADFTDAAMAPVVAKIVAKILKANFPWLGTNQEAGGADTVQELADLYKDLLAQSRGK